MELYIKQVALQKWVHSLCNAPAMADRSECLLEAGKSEATVGKSLPKSYSDTLIP